MFKSAYNNHSKRIKKGGLFMDMKDLRKNAIINVITKQEESITGRYLGIKDEKIRIIPQKKIVVDDEKLLGNGLIDRTLIRCSKDFGQPIEIPERDVKTWCFARYDEMDCEGTDTEEYFWDFFHYYDAKYLHHNGEKVTQYNSAGFFKGERESEVESIPGARVTPIESTPNI